MRFTKNKLLNAVALKKNLKSGEKPIALFKDIIKKAKEELKLHQNSGVSASEIVSKYTWMMDQLVVIAWKHHKHFLPENTDIELVAVGGYGRGELHAYSDIDLLILLSDGNAELPQDFVENYLRFLWDIGLDVGHSVRTQKECLKEAKADITIMTNLLEARHLTGNNELFSTLDEKLRNSRIWPANKFFLGKFDEQLARHATYQDTAYSLEPNIKESPGGLRDLQTILWVYNRHYGVTTFKQMHKAGHIDADEYKLLIRSRNILWKLRSGLHLNNQRREDRLLFDSQRQLAQDFGYKDTDNHLAVEQLMKRFYRTAKSVIYLNEVLLSNYKLSNDKLRIISKTKVIDDDFHVKHKLIEMRHEDLFQTKPSAMLSLFVRMQEQNVLHIHPNTIRALRTNLSQINNSFRNQEENRQLFIQLFNVDGVGITNALAKMNAYGVLGAYLPAFGSIVGQMQHDLFHVYTVDGHTLMVIRNINHLRKYPDRFPIATKIFSSMYKPERLFLAALFHDIAKGRGGDHSVLGEKDAYDFSIEHSLSEYDAKLISWLVANHLYMSHFSQRRDITDPEVIKEFADLVGDLEHLDNLYLLTLADIRGTSPKVWNAWKGQLLLDLYNATRYTLHQGMTTPIDEDVHVKDDQDATLALLEGKDINVGHLQEFWSTLSNDYFIRNEPYYIAWHAYSLCESSVLSLPIVSARYSERLEANMFFVFAPESVKLLSKVTAAFDQTELNIVEARIQSTTNGFALYTFTAIAPDADLAKKKKYCISLEGELRHLIIHVGGNEIISRSNVSRALKHFPITTKVIFNPDNSNYTVMEVIAQDQPGLLHNVALILQRNNIKLASAKISTLGARAEDVFFIQKWDGSLVTDKATLTKLSEEICLALDKN